MKLRPHEPGTPRPCSLPRRNADLTPTFVYQVRRERALRLVRPASPRAGREHDRRRDVGEGRRGTRPPTHRRLIGLRARRSGRAFCEPSASTPPMPIGSSVRGGLSLHVLAVGEDSLHARVQLLPLDLILEVDERRIERRHLADTAIRKRSRLFQTEELRSIREQPLGRKCLQLGRRDRSNSTQRHASRLPHRARARRRPIGSYGRVTRWSP
jgi:hypothetical protein